MSRMPTRVNLSQMVTGRLAVTALSASVALCAALTPGRAERAGGAGLYTTQQAAVGRARLCDLLRQLSRRRSERSASAAAGACLHIARHRPGHEPRDLLRLHRTRHACRQHGKLIARAVCRDHGVSFEGKRLRRRFEAAAVRCGNAPDPTHRAGRPGTQIRDPKRSSATLNAPNGPLLRAANLGRRRR